MVRPAAEGGWGLDALWADDLHHELRCLLAGDSEGYYADYSGTAADLARTIELGWFYCGQPSKHLKKPRGSDPIGLPRHVFVVCLQNHDQVGNRAFGERLHHQIDLAAYRAATALLLCCPATPLLFMGQEWACSTPFRFFTDHTPELGRQVTEGRRREFRHFSAFSDPVARERIPDPQSPATFEASRLKWDERDRPPHRGVWELYRRLLRLRQTHPDLFGAGEGRFSVRAAGDSAVVLRREAEGKEVLIVCRLRGGGTVAVEPLREGEWSLLLHTEEPAFCEDGRPPRADSSGVEGIRFARPGAVLLERK
jgi:maltooligosyltrehalose trehalohydrolase